MTHDSGITIRRPRFSFPAQIDPVIIEGEPEESYVTIALSLLLPYLEPYLIRSMREARKQVTDERLRAEIDLFNGQEGQHYREHMRFNEVIHRHGFERLEELETELAEDYQRYSKTRSLRFNLAYAEGFEAYTSALARFSFEQGRLSRMLPPVRDLFEWHLVEELEHRNVAFDVYDRVCGGYVYRLLAGLFAQWHLNQFVLRATFRMLRSDRHRLRDRYGGLWRALKRLSPQLWLATWHLFPRVLATYMPWYTPHRVGMPAGAAEIAQHYTELAAQRSAVQSVGPS